MVKANTIQAQLALSLDAANKKAKAKPAAAQPAPGGGRCSKLSISLFAGDLARLDAIRDFMQLRGERISTSQAIKLALRTAPLNDDLAAALNANRAEDGRGKW